MTPSNAQGLRSTGLKVTQPRLRILEIFQKGAMRHMTAEDVYRELLNDHSRDIGRDIGLATVYRVLTQFEQAGILSRTHFESGKAIFEINEGKHHDHLLCLDCGRVEEFVDTEIERRQRNIAVERGFELQDHSLALYASCRRDPCPHRPAPGSRFDAAAEPADDASS